MKKQTIVVIIIFTIVAIICDILLFINEENDDIAQESPAFTEGVFNTQALNTATQPALQTETLLQPTVNEPTLTNIPDPTIEPIIALTKPPIYDTTSIPTYTQIPTFTLVPTVTPVPTAPPTSTIALTPTPTENQTPYPTMVPGPVQTAKPTDQPLEDIENIDFSQKTITVSAMNGQYKTQGRCPVKNGAVYLNYSASAFTFNAYCEGTVTMDLYTQRNWSADGMYISVIVDGVKVLPRKTYKLKGNKQHTITIATDLEKGVHTFVIEKQSEATFGSVQIKSVLLNGEIAPAPIDEDLFIEFIGDSIISGYGVLYPNHSEGEYSSNQSSSVYQDATKTFAYLTAKKLKVDYSIVSETGIGILGGYTDRKMSEVYTKTCAQTGDYTDWSFTKRADAVVITLGTNDNSMLNKGAITKAQMREGFKNFALQVRIKNPSSKIVWAYGALGHGAKDSIISVLNELGGEASGYYYVNLEYNGDGGGGHPSLEANAKNAEILAQALQRILCG